jgi:hypothetical protein
MEKDNMTNKRRHDRRWLRRAAPVPQRNHSARGRVALSVTSGVESAWPTRTHAHPSTNLVKMPPKTDGAAPLPRFGRVKNNLKMGLVGLPNVGACAGPRELRPSSAGSTFLNYRRRR